MRPLRKQRETHVVSSTDDATFGVFQVPLFGISAVETISRILCDRRSSFSTNVKADRRELRATSSFAHVDVCGGSAEAGYLVLRGPLRKQRFDLS